MTPSCEEAGGAGEDHSRGRYSSLLILYGVIGARMEKKMETTILYAYIYIEGDYTVVETILTMRLLTNRKRERERVREGAVTVDPIWGLY